MNQPVEPSGPYDRLYLDTTVLANLARAGHVDVVADVVEYPRTSYAVRGELERGVDAGFETLADAVDHLADPLEPDDTGGITVAGSLVHQRKPELLDRLAASEASVLYQAWAADAPLATDDADVRAVAASYQVPVTGSLAVVVRAVERGVLGRDAADEALTQWRAEGLTVPVDSVAALLAD